jgi:T5SS/PEP-CTERM-associated repeat protein
MKMTSTTNHSIVHFARLVEAVAILCVAGGVGPVQGATLVVRNTGDTGAGSLRQAILSANLTVNVPDLIQFNIPGAGPHTISPVTPLPPLTDPAVIDGYSQLGASANTLTNGDDAVIQIVVLGPLVIDTTNSAVRGLAIPQIQVGAVPGPKGSNVIEGCFIGLDATGTNSLGLPGSGVFVQTPSNRIGGANPAARNLVSGRDAVGIEIFESFASNNVVQGNFIGTDRTGTKAIGNADRAVVVNQNASATLIGGEAAGAGNVISGNLDRGITLDGSNNIVYGNFIGTTVTGHPLGNARTGVEIGGSNNRIGDIRRRAGNLIAFNGVDGRGFTTNGVDVKMGTTFFTILGNSIFENAGLGIDVNADSLVTPGFPLITLVSNTTTATLIKGSNMPNIGFFLELFTNPAADPSGYGEGKTLLVSTNIATDADGNFTINWPVPLAPGLFLTATANANTEFSQARMVAAAGRTNSWTNNASGKWERGPDWSLNVPPFAGHSLVLITNAGTKTVTNDAATATDFPTTMAVSNLVISAPTGTTNTLLLAHGGTSTPLRVLRTLSLKSGGAVTINNGALNLEGPPNSPSHLNGALTLVDGTLTATNSSQFYIGSSGTGSLTVSNGTFRAHYPIVGINPGASGTWHIAGGTNIVTQVFDIGDSLTATGTVKMTGGLLTTPNIYVGLFGNGSLIVSNGTFRCAGQMDIASQPGAQGNFTAGGGGICTMSRMLVSGGPGATGSVMVASNALVIVDGPLDNIGGTVRMEGGTLIVSNLLLLSTNGQFIFNRGILETRNCTVTNAPFVVGNGTNFAAYQLIPTPGGTNFFARGLRIANNAVLTGNGVIAGNITNSGAIAPGDTTGFIDLNGSLVLSNSADLRIEIGGYTPEIQYDVLYATGSVALGGKLSVSLTNNFQSVMTNGASFVVLAGGSNLTGAFTNVTSGGQLTTTDGYARFTVLYAGSNTVRLANLVIVDTDGDSLPNWWEDRYGLDKNSAADAALDLDGDGVSSASEFLAGTLPNDPTSVFRIVSFQRESGNTRITWTTVGGKRYRVQTNAPTGNGGFANRFADLSPLITVGGNGEFTTNFLHNGGLTNVPARYYRIRLEP